MGLYDMFVKALPYLYWIRTLETQIQIPFEEAHCPASDEQISYSFLRVEIP